MRKRVLYLLVYSTLDGGIAHHVFCILKEFVKSSSYEFAVCTVAPRGDLSSALDSIGVKNYSLGFRDFNSFGVFGAFRRVCRKFNPDILHIHVITFWQWIYLAIFAHHIPVLYTVHSDYGGGTWKKRLLRRFLPIRVDEYIFVSKSVRKAYDQDKFPGRVIYNCVPKDDRLDFDKLRRVLGFEKKQQIIGTACKIGLVKRPKCFVRVMVNVLLSYPDAHAVVIGDGDVEVMSELKNIVDRAGVSDRFHFMGYRSDARELIAGISVFVVTSEREGMPTAMLEAMSAGVPVAFLRGRGGLRDLEELNSSPRGPFGIIVSENDEFGLSKGICNLMMNDTQYRLCAKNAKRVCEEVFDFDKEFLKLKNVYRKL